MLTEVPGAGLPIAQAAGEREWNDPMVGRRADPVFTMIWTCLDVMEV